MGGRRAREGKSPERLLQAPWGGNPVGRGERKGAQDSSGNAGLLGRVVQGMTEIYLPIVIILDLI